MGCYNLWMKGKINAWMIISFDIFSEHTEHVFHFYGTRVTLAQFIHRKMAIRYLECKLKTGSEKTRRTRTTCVFGHMRSKITDVIIGAIAFQITSLVVYSTVYSDADQRKHQRPASLAFVWGIHVSILWRHHDIMSFEYELLISCCNVVSLYIYIAHY